MVRRRGGGEGGLPGYMTPGVVARLLGVSDSRVRQLALSGELPEATRVAGARLFRRTDVERFMRTRDKKRRQR